MDEESSDSSIQGLADFGPYDVGPDGGRNLIFL